MLFYRVYTRYARVIIQKGYSKRYSIGYSRCIKWGARLCSGVVGAWEGARPRKWIETGWEILGAKGVDKVR